MKSIHQNHKALVIKLISPFITRLIVCPFPRKFSLQSHHDRLAQQFNQPRFVQLGFPSQTERTPLIILVLCPILICRFFSPISLQILTVEVAGGSGDYLQNISHVPGAGQGWLRRGLRMSGRLLQRIPFYFTVNKKAP